MRLSHVIAVLVAAVALGRARPAHADKRAQAQALQLAEESEKLYKAGQFEKSAGLLRKAHGIYPEPILLYNLGRALEGMGDNKGAVAAYEQYLKDAKQIDDRPAIERRVATLKAQIDKDAKLRQEQLAAQQAAQQPHDTKPPPEPEPPPEPKPPEPVVDEPLPPHPMTPPPGEDDRSAVSRIGPWVTLGTGAALVATGVVLGISAQQNHSDATTAGNQQRAASLQDSAQTDATIANVMFVVGGAAMIGGAVWEYLEWQSGKRRDAEREKPGAHLRVSPTGAAFAWTW